MTEALTDSDQALSAQYASIGQTIVTAAEFARLKVEHIKTRIAAASQVGGTAIEAATNGHASFEELEQELGQARYDFDVLEALAQVLESYDEHYERPVILAASPEAAQVPEPDPESEPEPEAELPTVPDNFGEILDNCQHGPGRKVSARTIEVSEDILRYLIEKGGKLTAAESVRRNVGQQIKQDLGIESRSMWICAFKFLDKIGLINTVKLTPRSRLFSEISVDKEALQRKVATSQLTQEPVLPDKRRKARLGVEQPVEIEEAGNEPEEEDEYSEAGDESEEYADEIEDSAEDDTDELDEPADSASSRLDIDLIKARHTKKTTTTAAAAAKRAYRAANAWRNKTITFFIKSHGQVYVANMTAGKFSELGTDTKLVMAVALLNTPARACIDTEESRQRFLLNMLNKGISEEKAIDVKGLQGLTQRLIADGYLSANGNGPVLTEDGMGLVMTVKPGRGRPKVVSDSESGTGMDELALID